jgi:plasmid maintenance system killer protein
LIEILFANEKLKNLVEDFPKLKKQLGDKFAKQIKMRIDQLESYSNISELLNGPIDNPHLLGSNMSGCIGWSVNANNRIILKLIDNPTETFFEDAKKIDKIIFKGVVDYHGKNDWVIN